MSRQVLGQMKGGKFVPIAEVNKVEPDQLDGYVQPATIEQQQQRRIGEQQLETIEHVLAAIDVEALDFGELDRLFDVGHSLIERWLAEVKRRGGIA